MEAIDLVMKIFGIREGHREDVERALETASPKHIGLVLANMAQHPDDEDFDPAIDKWMATNIPELRFV